MALSAVPALGADIDRPIIGNQGGFTYVEPTGVTVEDQGGVTGYVEGSFNKAFDTPYDVDSRTWALRGSVNFEGDSGLNLQIDANYARTSTEHVDVNQLGGAGHIYYRDPSLAVGGFFQANRLDAGYLDYLGDDAIKDYMGGIEAAWFTDPGTLYGRLGYGQATFAGYSADHYLGSVSARFYVNDNLRFDVEGSLNRISYSTVDLDTQSVVISGNYRTEAMPVTLFAGYRYDHLDLSANNTSITTGNTNTVFAGLRFSYGSRSLKDEERKGPVWTASTLLP